MPPMQCSTFPKPNSTTELSGWIGTQATRKEEKRGEALEDSRGERTSEPRKMQIGPKKELPTREETETIANATATSRSTTGETDTIEETGLTDMRGGTDMIEETAMNEEIDMTEETVTREVTATRKKTAGEAAMKGRKVGSKRWLNRTTDSMTLLYQNILSISAHSAFIL